MSPLIAALCSTALPLSTAAAHDWLDEETIYGYNPRHLNETVSCEVRRWDDVVTRRILGEDRCAGL